MNRLKKISGAALPLLCGAVLCGVALTGCTATGQTPGNAAVIGLPNNTGQTVWRQPCDSYDNFGARLSVDQCGGGGGGPFIR